MLNKKIIIAISCLMRGGTEMQTLLLSRALIESGYNVEICCYFENDKSVVKEFKAIGTEITLLNWSRTIGTVQFIRSLALILRKKKPDIIHIQYMTPGLLPIIAARLAGAKVILVTVNYPGTPHGLKEKILLRLGSRLANGFICVSEAVEKSWFNDTRLIDLNNPEQIKEIKHFTVANAIDIVGIDVALEASVPKMSEIADNLKEKIVIGAVARLSREKGIDILIEALAKVKKVLGNAHLLIVGDGDQLSYLKSSACNLKIEDSITWTGKLPWDEAMGYIKLMDVVAVPSRYEGFGLSAVEAMACGKPVVASRVDGLPEAIQDGMTGTLVLPENSSELASALIELLKNKERRQKIGNAARKYIEQNYSYTKFRETYKVIYEHLR